MLAFPSAAQEEDDQHRREQLPPPVEPETSGYPEEYKVMSLGPAGHAPRLWLKGKWGEMFPSLPWNPRPAIFVDLDRETRTIPQSFEIHSKRGMVRIEGFNLEALAEWLNAQHVTKIFTYCEKRWPGTRFVAGEAKVTRFKWTWFDDEMGEKAQKACDASRARLVKNGDELDGRRRTPSLTRPASHRAIRPVNALRATGRETSNTGATTGKAGPNRSIRGRQLPTARRLSRGDWRCNRGGWR